MKYLLTACILFITTGAAAQIVNIPDPAFKQELLQHSPTIDINHNNEIEVSEALAVTYLQINDFQATNMTGIESFANLQTAYISTFTVLSLDFSGLAALTDLEINGELLTSINLTGCAAIKNLKIYNNNTSTVSMLDLHSCVSLEKLELQFVNINSIDLSNCLNLETLTIMNNQLLSSIDLSHNSKLKRFSCEYSPLTSMDFTHCPILEGVNLSNNLVTEVLLGSTDSLDYLRYESNSHLHGDLDLTHYKKLKFFWTQNCSFTSINLSGLNKLTSLYCDGPDLLALNLEGCSAVNSLHVLQPVSMINLHGCIGLKEFYLMANVRNVDLSSCVDLNTLYIYSNDSVENLNLKNGSMLTDFYLLFPVPVNICADNFEIDTLQHYLINNNQQGNVSSYCSFFPGGNYNSIIGKVRVDINNNGCDSNDPGITQIPVVFTEPSGQTTIRYTYTEGEYANYVYTGNFTLNPYFAYPYFTIAPLSANVIFDTANNIISTNNFCVTPNGIHKDLEITFLPLSFARPGFNTQYRIVFKNRGTNVASGNLKLNFDNSKMNFIAATTNVSSQNPGELNWNYTDLLPFQSRSIDVTFGLLPIPVNNIGDTLIYLATVNPVAGDETPDDNSFILPQRVRGSMDPNEKECLEGSKIDITTLGNYLHYLIRFQNLGNDTAFNIVVVDTLSNNVEWNSVEFIGSSHPCHVTQKNGKLEFFFADIKLPYKSINEPASNGFVAFKVKPKTNLVLGDSLNNRAAIYFDYNPPVITNTAMSVVSPQRLSPVTLEYFSANSNGNNNLLTWKVRTSNGFTSFIVERSDDNAHYTEIGNITATVAQCQLPFDFTDDQPMPGKNYYRLRITGADGNSFYSDAKLIERTGSGFQVTAIINDQNNTTVYLNAPKQQTVQMKIVAADGRMMYSQAKAIPAGHNLVNLSLKNWAKGIYILIVYTNDGEMMKRRFLK